jgi:hypothetical protein
LSDHLASKQTVNGPEEHDQHVPRLSRFVRNNRGWYQLVVVGMHSTLFIGIGVAAIAVGVASVANEVGYRHH